MSKLTQSYWDRYDTLLEASTRLSDSINESLGEASPSRCHSHIISESEWRHLTGADNSTASDAWRDSTTLITTTIAASSPEDLEEARSTISTLFNPHDTTDTHSEVFLIPPWAKPANWSQNNYPAYFTVRYSLLDNTHQHADILAMPLHQPIALALSGGGMRAAIYQLGIFAYLAQHNRLRNVQEIVSVSGGSILAAHFVKHWPESITRLSSFRTIAADMLRICRSNVRDTVFIPWIWSFLKPQSWFIRSQSRSGRLQATYRAIFNNTTLGDLVERRPRIAIVATDSVRQQRIAFTQTHIFRWPIINADSRSLPPINSQGVELSLAVAASSCFPPVFPRFHLTHQELGITYSEFQDNLQLNDGGVTSNLGIEVLVALRSQDWPKNSLVLIADAERNLAIKPSNSPLTDSDAALAALGKAARDIAKREFGDNGIVVPFTQRVCIGGGLAFITETALFNYRTDLDSPTWQEIHALMIHGAMVARQATRERFGEVSVEALRQTITTIIAEAGGPADLELPTESDLRSCGMRPLLRCACHIAGVIAVGATVLAALYVAIHLAT
jgi:predicted acylesterase/phospholipase RssA